MKRTATKVEGTVTSKTHRDAHSRLIPITVGKVTTLTRRNYPECWQITVKGPNSGDVRVTKATYDSLHIGDHYDNNQM